MSVLEVPASERKPWPSLGGAVCDLMEQALTFGPGDLRGQPYRLDDEKRRLVWRLYEVYPRDHPNAGRRRFRRAALSMRKGSAKTELGAAIVAVELHPDGPVRCDGWRREGREWVPVGAPVRDPYIPMLAYTEEQSEELAYGALLVMLAEGRDHDLFDIGLGRVMRRRGDGKAQALATAPDSRDGARTTFELFDETHRLVLPRQKEAHRTGRSVAFLDHLRKRKRTGREGDAAVLGTDSWPSWVAIPQPAEWDSAADYWPVMKRVGWRGEAGGGHLREPFFAGGRSGGPVSPDRPALQDRARLAQLGRWRRLSRCSEGSEASATAWLEVASVGYLLARAFV